MKKQFKSNKAQAGLSILLGVIVMIFVIGLLVGIFTIMSGEIRDQDILYSSSGTRTKTAEAVTQANFVTGGASGHGLDVENYRDVTCTLTAVTNGSAGGIKLGAGNYSEVSECHILNVSAEYKDASWYVNYTYVYQEDAIGTGNIINDTGTSIAGVTSWFDIVVVITAMVVLILLVVVIITAIKGSGLMAGANGRANSIGTA